MKLTSSFASLIVCAVTLASAHDAHLEARRTSSLLISPPGLPKLPTASAATAAAATVGLNLTDIQGDIVTGMTKNRETFLFFGIADAPSFKSKLRSGVLPLITTAMQMTKNSTQPTTLVNVAFSHTGLGALNVSDTLGDGAFTGGQLADAGNLGDPGTSHWVSQFVGTNIHGVFLLASDTDANVASTVTAVTTALGDSITQIYTLQAAARPGAEQGHEHFGFLDGISNPAIQGFDDSPLPGQASVPPGEIIVGETGDPFISQRPPWAIGGSFLAFRQLEQLVPEFNKFLTDNPIRAPGFTDQQGSDLLGARMVGRWKSGAPVFLSPLADDPALGADPTRNNNFTYALNGSSTSSSTDQSRCPFSAHIRKTRPRADLGLPENTGRHILRGGIPYGPEVSDSEAASNTTSTERGLAFVSYQSSIGNGFQFLQRFWADNTGFVEQNTGFDPIIGANKGANRTVGGLDPTDPSRTITLITDFVVSRGGEYFFSPSLSALANTFTV
ncbi:fungal peroxidase [Roridomyces roridus]|uniref:Fungal peroxidase n=1 Tax=Roridomyces roridus TaxID=1738132 RepID=A0AAD7BMA0_9AGAR|nr:fungal peroxidase [Roridomyces roridus]